MQPSDEKSLICTARGGAEAIRTTRLVITEPCTVRLTRCVFTPAAHQAAHPVGLGFENSRLTPPESVLRREGCARTKMRWHGRRVWSERRHSTSSQAVGAQGLFKGAFASLAQHSNGSAHGDGRRALSTMGSSSLAAPRLGLRMPTPNLLSVGRPWRSALGGTNSVVGRTFVFAAAGLGSLQIAEQREIFLKRVPPVRGGGVDRAATHTQPVPRWARVGSRPPSTTRGAALHSRRGPDCGLPRRGSEADVNKPCLG